MKGFGLVLARPFLLQADQRGVEHDARPLHLEDFLRRRLLTQLCRDICAALRVVERNRLPATTPFLGGLPFAFVCHEEFQRTEQEGTEAPFLRLRALQRPVLEHVREKRLRQIFGVVR